MILLMYDTLEKSRYPVNSRVRLTNIWSKEYWDVKVQSWKENEVGVEFADKTVDFFSKSQLENCLRVTKVFSKPPEDLGFSLDDYLTFYY